ncbi:hypothetical protein BD324DRAFT_626824 [Kockovaella imperatae]|uniref:Enoyl reductase (ER) domain-containing protein n=1 Tax=Kockovaella imperatae TaxID=4999 RepID=A0A1Y1UF94_9TREE|nr:hypothetical protein BD324DRAFT_626824 [Kockovaella imperatae]ORX36688.1 hypothetical protein BD324DRAFT_626824 [Kockovaella imperatae]
MPKPTLIQTVFRKPTRSYASANYRNPYADYDDDSLYDSYRSASPAPSKYTSHMDHGVHLGYTEINNPRYATAGGSSKRRSTVSGGAGVARASVATETGDGSTQPSAGTMFPKPVKRTSGTVSVRGTMVVVTSNDVDDLTEVTRSGTVKKKKKKTLSQPGGSEVGSVISSVSRTPTARRTNQSAPSTLAHPKPSSSVRSRTPRPEYDIVDSSASSPQSTMAPPPLPRRKPKPAPISTPLESMIAPPLTPPISEKSDSNSRHRDYHSGPEDPNEHPAPLPTRPIKSPKRKSVGSATHMDDDGDEQDIFYTPKTSIDPNSARSTMVEPPTSAQLAPPAPPAVVFQPATPAVEPDETPFHSEQSSTVSATLHPNDNPIEKVTPRRSRDSVQSPTPKRRTRKAPPPVDPTGDDADDAESGASEIGAEESQELESRRVSPGAPSRVDSARSSPIEGSRSRPPSVTDSSREPRPKSRASARGSNYDDFVVVRRDSSYARSEVSLGGRSARSARSGREGSVSGTSGYGKGGWAAAAASASGATSPVGMYMPTNGHDGWADFHPPPRQSKFTPLPPASQPQTFDRLVHGVQDRQEPPEESYPSSYESSDDEDDQLPQPSRSYARRTNDPSPSHSLPSSNSAPTPPEVYQQQRLDQLMIHQPSRLAPESEPDSPSSWHQDTLRRLVGISLGNGPINHPGLPERPDSRSELYATIPRIDTDTSPDGRPSSRRSQTAPSETATYLSMPYSTRSYSDRPMSPTREFSGPPRPSSRVGFEPPSMLNPDTLTLLPEMSAEDSAKTYEAPEIPRPPSRKQGSVKRAASVFSVRSRASKSEFEDYAEERKDVVGELLPIRKAKSAVSFRNSGQQDWEGSSAGEGVLMESHGRDSDSVGGYTSGLVLPAGAYKPADPTKSASEINARILGMPHANMAAVTLATLPSRDTPLHLRTMNPPVDFTSYVKPPTKVGKGQLLVQIYATAVDVSDIRALDDKTKADVHKWVPGRSFVGRCLSAGMDEKDIVRGDIVVGLLDIKKSGALAEYILCDRRRLARAPYPTSLTLEQMSLLPLQGIPAARLIRAALVRNSRALIMDANAGIAALICQEMSRAGVNVTALIPGGEDTHEAQTACMANGARGVLIGSPAAVILSLDEGGWDFIFDTAGGQRVYEAAKRILKNGARLVSTVKYDVNAVSPIHNRTSGFKALRMAFANKRKDSKFISFEYLAPAGTGEPEVDASGMDCRDVLEDTAMVGFRPVVRDVFPLERGPEAFKPVKGPHVSVVRLVN